MDIAIAAVAVWVILSGKGRMLFLHPANNWAKKTCGRISFDRT
jgi:hypothetical protein